MHKGGLVPSANCSYGGEEQMVDYILVSCSSTTLQTKRTLGLAALDDDTVDWLQTTALSI